MPDGSVPAPDGWSRFQLEVADVDATYEQLLTAGCTFRSPVMVGNGGKQVLINDPAGNPIELFQPQAALA